MSEVFYHTVIHAFDDDDDDDDDDDENFIHVSMYLADANRGHNIKIK